MIQKRVLLIALIYGNCKTGIEKTEFETKIEYNEKISL